MVQTKNEIAKSMTVFQGGVEEEVRGGALFPWVNTMHFGAAVEPRLDF